MGMETADDGAAGDGVANDGAAGNGVLDDGAADNRANGGTTDDEYQKQWAQAAMGLA